MQSENTQQDNKVFSNLETMEDNSTIDAYLAKLRDCGAEQVEFFEQDPDDFYEQFDSQTFSKEEAEHSMIMCIGGIYRSGHARVFTAQRGYKTIGKEVDIEKDPKAQGISTASFCSKDLEAASY